MMTEAGKEHASLPGVGGDSRADSESGGSAELATIMSRLHGLLLSADDANEAVTRLALVARSTVTSAVGAGASLLDASGVHSSRGSTDGIARELDRAQYELEEGPCLTAWASRRPQRIDDTTNETRWKRWVEVAARMGVRSVLSAPMSYKRDSIGALKVYSNLPLVFGEDDERRLTHLADAAGALLGASAGPDDPSRISESLTEALHTRRTVELATGVLMERHGLSQEAARRLLLATSRAQRRPLLELAGEVVTGMDHWGS